MLHSIGRNPPALDEMEILCHILFLQKLMGFLRLVFLMFAFFEVDQQACHDNSYCDYGTYDYCCWERVIC